MEFWQVWLVGIVAVFIWAVYDGWGERRHKKLTEREERVCSYIGNAIFFGVIALSFMIGVLRPDLRSNHSEWCRWLGLFCVPTEQTTGPAPQIPSRRA